MTKISIVMATYNGAQYLSEQLSSFSRQTILPNELIIVDDCSSDNTRNIILEYSASAPFDVKTIFNKRNIGSTKSFEKALTMASCDVIFFSDQDDIWQNNKIDIFLKQFERYEDAGLIASNAFIVDKNIDIIGDLWSQIGLNTEIQSELTSRLAFRRLLRAGYITGMSSAIRKDLIRQVLPIGGEWVHDRWISLICAACSSIRLTTLKTAFYRQHENQQIGARSSILQKVVSALSRNFHLLSYFLEKRLLQKQRILYQRLLLNPSNHCAVNYLGKKIACMGRYNFKGIF